MVSGEQRFRSLLFFVQGDKLSMFLHMSSNCILLLRLNKLEHIHTSKSLLLLWWSWTNIRPSKKKKRIEKAKKIVDLRLSSPSGNNSFLVFLHFSPEDETLPYETVFLTLLTHSIVRHVKLFFLFPFSLAIRIEFLLFTSFYLLVLVLTRTLAWTKKEGLLNLNMMWGNGEKEKVTELYGEVSHRHFDDY